MPEIVNGVEVATQPTPAMVLAGMLVLAEVAVQPGTAPAHYVVSMSVAGIKKLAEDVYVAMEAAR